MVEDFNISGTWINRLTGDKIVVRNTFIDGDNMIIQSSDGRQISMNEFQNYIQMSDDKNGGDVTDEINNIKDLEKERRVVVGAYNNASHNSPYNFDKNTNENIKSTLKTEEKKVITKNIEKEKPISESYKLLNKLFEKIDLDIDVKVDLDCTNFPVKELNMLQTFYDVSIDDISDYMIKNVINDTLFRSAVSTYIKNQLTN